MINLKIKEIQGSSFYPLIDETFHNVSPDHYAQQL